MKPEQRALNYLKSRRWIFDSEKDSLSDLKKSFKRNGCAVNSTAVLVCDLIKSGWSINSLNDIRNLDRARRIYQKYEKE